MPANIRIGGVRVDFSANATGYVTVAGQVQSINDRLARSYRSVGSAAGRQNRFVNQFTSSVRSSLIATAAYAAGVEGLRRIVAGSVHSFLAWEQGLIGVQKTTGLTDAATSRLEGRFDRLLTRTSALAQPLPVVASNLLEIAEVAGQMRIQAVPDIEAFTETVALLELTTELAGRTAANSIGIIIANTRAGVAEVRQIGSALTALGNQFRGGEADILTIAEDLARSTAEFQLPAQDLLAFAAVFAQTGARAEKTGTVWQRSIRALVDAASEAVSGSPAKLVAVAEAAGVSLEYLQDVISRRDFTQALLTLGQALANLPSQAAADQLTRGNLLTTLFGGETPPVRIAEILGVFAENLGEVHRALNLANAEWEEQIALLEEAGKFAEANALRLLVVQNQIASQGRALGETLTGPLVFIAENFKLVEVAIVGAATALAAGFGRRRFDAIRSHNDQIRLGLSLAERNARFAREAALQEVAAVEAANAARLRGGVAGFQRLTLAENLVRAQRGAQVATAAHVVTQQNLSRSLRFTSRAARAVGLAFNFLGGWVGLITTALTVGVTAWSLWWKNADDEPAGNKLISNLQRITKELRDAADGLTKTERQIRDAEVRLGELRLQEERLAQTDGEQAFSFGGLFGFATELEGVRKEIGGVEKALEDLRASEARFDLGPPLTANERVLAKAEESLAGLADEAQRLLSLPPIELSKLSPLAGQQGIISQRNLRNLRFDEIAQEAFGLQSQIFELDDALSDTEVTTDEAAASHQNLIVRLRELNLAIEEPTRSFRQYLASVARATQADRDRSRFLISVAGLSPFDREVETRAFDQRARLQVEAKSLEVTRDRNIENYNIAGGLLQQAKALRDQFAVGTKLREQAQVQVDNADKQLVRTRERVTFAEAALAFALAHLGVDKEAIREAVRLQNILSNTEAISARLSVAPADVEGQQVAASNFIRQIQTRVDLQSREADQAQQLKLLRGENLILARAEFEVTNTFFRERVRATQRVEDAERDLARFRRDYADTLAAAPSDEEDQSGRIEGLRREQKELANAVEEAKAYRDSLAETTDEELRLANAAGRAASRLAEGVRGAGAGIILATQLAASGIRQVEDTLVDAVTTGRVNFREFADAILADLSRILIRSTVVAFALRSLGIGADGQFTGGGLLGFLSGLFTRGAQSQFIDSPINTGGLRGVAHEGGIAGRLRPHRGSLRSNEVIAVLEKGEEVIPRTDVRHRFNLPRFHEGGVVGGGGGGHRIRIEIVPPPGTNQQVQRTTRRIDGDEYVIGVVLEDIGRGGPLAQALKMGGVR